jgi:DNA-binding XRE family transcriptional regulator
LEDFVEIKIKLRKDTYEDILSFIGFQNIDNKIDEGIELPTDYNVNDFITGCVNLYIKEINTLAKLSGYEDLNKPYQIKNRFKEQLKMRQINQKEFSKQVGINQSNLSQYLNNQVQPSLDAFIKIWVGLGCPQITDILYRED